MSEEATGEMTPDYHNAVSSIEEIIEDARNGKMFILVDHEDRENEGDLVIPAQMATPDAINFMATHGRGLICLTLTSERIDQLGLQLMSTHIHRATKLRSPFPLKRARVSPREYLHMIVRAPYRLPLMPQKLAPT